MNIDKAREYFSDYYEGTLERGLKETFERALRTDAQVQAEYRSFEKLMKELDLLASPAPEPDFDLHEAIARRLDKHIYEQKRRASHPLLSWWRSAALGGLATVALVAAILQLRSSGSTPTAGFLTSASEKIELTASASGYELNYSTGRDRELVIRTASGTELRRERVLGLKSIPINKNPNPRASLLEIEVVDDKELTYLAIPGSKVEPAAKGEGSLKNLALALAGFYQVPVAFQIGDEAILKWTLIPGEGLGAAQKALEGTHYTAQKNADGVLWIRPN